MKKIILLGIVLSLFVGCTKYNQIDTGISKAEYPGNMYEYFQSDSYNWDSLLVLIDHAGMKKYFTGEEPGYEEITFFGPTNHSIRRWLYGMRTNLGTTGAPDPEKLKISLQDPETCRNLLLCHIIKGKRKAASFPQGTFDDNNSGEVLIAANGKQFRVFTVKESFQNVAGAGPLTLYAVGIDKYNQTLHITMASTDIAPTNGIVHSLPYSFELGEIAKIK